MRSVLFFGIYDPGYSRNRVLRLGFERNGWKVEECRVDPTKVHGVTKYFVLLRMGLKARREKHDLVFVCFPGHTLVWLARILFGPRIVFDAFLSLYDSNVFDRKVYGASSFRARRDKFFDTWSCKLAHKVLLDTRAHIEYFSETFGIPRKKFIRAWISADDTVFYPTDVPRSPIFTVHFHGTFIPLQGIPYIVEAARLLKDEKIRFRIIGAGQEGPTIDAKIAELDLVNIERVGKVPVTQIPGYMAGADIVLGIFGDTDKAKRVIPNKVYEALAMGKAVITADTPAIRELPGASESMMLVPIADAGALGAAILILKNDPERREIFARDARALFERECASQRIVQGILSELQL